MIELKKPVDSLQFYLFDCILNIVPIALIAVEAAIKKREEKIFAFLKIKQNLEAYLQVFIFCKNEIRTSLQVYTTFVTCILRDTYFSMTGSAKHVSSLPTLCKQHL